ncbi:hypothetical protein BIW11_13750 [Tropilaelaps mercedesae]|uniref:Uncharacterized protein n=1 Tax=Tropilaelaps mercedesae TaxID=418985 RepID=A0A1V9X0H1_9ACAR|nr:hypothetical protein BIW11_13750 [Tropilaelaps mercedesae]
MVRYRPVFAKRRLRRSVQNAASERLHRPRSVPPKTCKTDEEVEGPLTFHG